MIEKLKSIGILELILIEVVAFIVVWLLNEYLAFLLTVIISAISFAVLVISLIAEAIEKSKVSKLFFLTLFLIGLTPLVVGAVFYVINQGVSFE
jgi:hypothetical protein